jgi:23S rRNA pseudouridine1911/1915/1917 synthase
MSQPEENFSDYNPNAPLQFAIPLDCAGLRLDQALARMLPEYSRSRLQSWIESGAAMLDGNVATIKQKVWGGEAVSLLPTADPYETSFAAEDIALDIVFEDDAIIIINKPAGLVVHPGSGNWQGTLLNALLHHAPQLATIPRAGIVHRLDKDTSGLMVVAKTLPAQTDLVRQLQARTVKREYLAIVQGIIAYDDTVDAPIGRHPQQRIKMAIVHNGKAAVTHFEVLERFKAQSLVLCRLETGRTHQIRVHMQSIAHPLLGDPVYGGKSKVAGVLAEAIKALGRQALHATRLGLVHPVSGEEMSWEVELPEDMERLLDVLHDE